MTTTELPYPKLTGIWAEGSHSPSLSEQFNENLPPWLRFTGELRERFTDYSGNSFKPNSTNDYEEQRIRLGMMIKPTNWVRFYTEWQDARAFGITPAQPPYQDTAQLFEAYALFGATEGNGFSLQAGRFQMSYGNNRLIGDSWWTQVSRSFDGVRAAYQVGRLRVDAFATSVVIMRQGVFDHHLQGNNLYGLYATARNVIPRATFDVYELWNLRPSFSVQNLKGHLDEWTTGFRLVGALPYHLDYRTEIAYQVGTLATDKIRAWMGHWTGGYTFQESRIRPRLFVEFDYGSGSSNVKGGTDNTFDPIYPSTHDKLGLADLAGWRNIEDLRFGQEFKLARKWTLATAIHDYWLADAHDAFYPTRGSVVAADSKGKSGTHVGEELDIQTIYTPTRQTQVGTGYGRMIPGEFLKNTTKGVSYNVWYMLTEYVF
ncbi:MAG TPA: alginate export family protein [Bryobacteraceae bacterium]|nr:alginate export family protein [Bryobacteraceae bacterium]